MTVVGVACCGSYDRDAVLTAVEKAVNAAGGLPPVRGKRVLIKPNLLSDLGADSRDCACSVPDGSGCRGTNSYCRQSGSGTLVHAKDPPAYL